MGRLTKCDLQTFNLLIFKNSQTWGFKYSQNGNSEAREKKLKLFCVFFVFVTSRAVKVCSAAVRITKFIHKIHEKQNVILKSSHSCLTTFSRCSHNYSLYLIVPSSFSCIIGFNRFLHFRQCNSVAFCLRSFSLICTVHLFTKINFSTMTPFFTTPSAFWPLRCKSNINFCSLCVLFLGGYEMTCCVH